MKKAAASAVALIAMTVGTAVVGPAAPAHATAAECTGGANGFKDVPNQRVYGEQTVRSVGWWSPRGYVEISLEKGDPYGPVMGWARLSGATDQSMQVWMDWTKDGGKSWIQCGPFSPTTIWVGEPVTTPAQTVSSELAYRFRACGSFWPGNVTCTDWW